MREISRQDEPVRFTEWRAGSQNDINYGYDLIPSAIRNEIKDALISDQCGLCAYTGIGIDASRAHVEHLLPQTHGRRGQDDVAYGNMVACYPGTGRLYVPFGALLKASWQSPAEQHLFVSPWSAGCERRFTFSLRGKISSPGDDEAAAETIKRLGLDNRRLEALRNEAIDATLKRKGENPPMLNLALARRRLTTLEDAETAGGKLEPFCFALKQALHKHIQRLESIRESKRRERS
jgi:uncharacterized protein (TIGR02646 family)